MIHREYTLAKVKQIASRQEGLPLAKTYNFAAEVDRYASEHGGDLAVFTLSGADMRTMTYAELVKAAASVQSALMHVGIHQGDRILVMLPRGIESYYVYLGLNRLGAVILPGSEMLRAKDITYRIRHAQVKAVVIAPHLANEMRQALCDDPKVIRFCVGAALDDFIHLDEMLSAHALDQLPSANTEADEIAFISYTSGTTGGPKGVVHVNGWPKAHIDNAAVHWFDVQPGEWAWATASPGWAKWIWSPFVSILGMGGTAFVYIGKFDAKRYLELMEEYPIGLLCATPTEYRMMAKSEKMAAWRPHSLRSAVSAGEPLNREVIEAFYQKSHVFVRDGYGQTENSLLVATQVGQSVKPGSMGKPSPLHDVAVIDEDGVPVPTGIVGDIAVKQGAATLFQGYLYDPERTAKAYRGEFYVTGDLGRFDEDGYLWFEGRSDDIIISAGYTIGPFEVEDALVSHPDVAECAAVASPDEERGHIVKAFVVVKEGVPKSEEEIQKLQQHVKLMTAPYKYPREIEFVEELPKTISGKIRRVELRALERVRKTLPRK